MESHDLNWLPEDAKRYSYEGRVAFAKAVRKGLQTGKSVAVSYALGYAILAKFNPNHDNEGKFSSGSGSGAGAAGSDFADWATRKPEQQTLGMRTHAAEYKKAQASPAGKTLAANGFKLAPHNLVGGDTNTVAPNFVHFQRSYGSTEHRVSLSVDNFSRWTHSVDGKKVASGVGAAKLAQELKI